VTTSQDASTLVCRRQREEKGIFWPFLFIDFWFTLWNNFAVYVRFLPDEKRLKGCTLTIGMHSVQSYSYSMDSTEWDPCGCLNAAK